MKSHDRARFSESILYPTLLVLIMWLIKGFEAISGEHLGQFGIFPLQAKGLIGIITAPFLHANAAHLFANSIPLWVLGSLLFYVYRPV
ncbi:MAG: rhomboid family intramembrane serine protease, partial [Victivallaceae bacterium]